MKTPHKKLIEFLEKRELAKQADILKNGNTALFLISAKIYDSALEELTLILKDNSTVTRLYLAFNLISVREAKKIGLMI